LIDKRDSLITFLVNDREKELIKERIRESGTVTQSAYLRKMAIDGMIIKLDISEIKEMISLLRRMSNNINQIARKVNSTGVFSNSDVEEIQNKQEELWVLLNKIMRSVSLVK